ncbi:hypothetical protein LTS07_011436 [Exophiala sideris]|uniref:Myb-like domain-containing protein n=1 Tax=Exophiala sideris TaxID=1016849 RepID=A0ABR0IU19_9EURO|nr:hypothetical protein LTS07_011436 [Exophiala sideris]KAK5047849.1 hypothetical protein LTR69_011476 [Exophiala sideris]
MTDWDPEKIYGEPVDKPSSPRDQTSETPLLCRSPLHGNTAGERRTLEETSLHGDFSLAQTHDGLAESLDDDLDSLFSGVLPDLECSETTGFNEDFDGQAENYTSRFAETCNIIISSPSDDLDRSETPSLRANSHAIDLTIESNCPHPKQTATPSPQRNFPSSRHKARIEVVIPSRRPSPVSQRNLSGTQSGDVMMTPNATRRPTVSPRLSGHEHVTGRKRRCMSESDLDSLNSRRVRVEADTNKTPTLVHQTIDEGSTDSSRGKQTQPHESGSKVGAPIGAGIHNHAYRSDSEQTLIDRGASINYEEQTGHTLLLRELSPTSSSNIDEPSNDHHEQERHLDRLKCFSLQPVTSGDAGFVTAIIDSPADLQDIFHSPTGWALGCGVQPDNLANIVLKPLADRCWLLTATISRCVSNMDNRRRDRARRSGRCSPDPDTSSDFCPSESETLPRPTKRGHWTLDEDDNLTEWRRLGKSWSWIFNQFPERSEAAVRSRWFVVLAPQATSTSNGS